MATFVAKHLSGAIRTVGHSSSSAGCFLARQQRNACLLNKCKGPLVNLFNSFSSSQILTDEILSEEDDMSEKLFSLTTLIVKGSDEAVLDSYTQFVTRAAKILNIDISRRTVLRTHFEKRTVLKSPHIYKKHRAQYEIRTHGRMMKLNNLTCDTSDVFLEYIQRNLPEGVSMNVEQTEVLDVPEYIRPPIQLTLETVEKKNHEHAGSSDNLFA
eukprot:gene19995-21956_t